MYQILQDIYTRKAALNNKKTFTDLYFNPFYYLSYHFFKVKQIEAFGPDHPYRKQQDHQQPDKR